MPVDVTTPTGQIRLLIVDLRVNGDPLQVFTEEELAGFLALEGGNVKRAAADALDAIAVDEVLTSKVIRSQDLTTDGAKVAEQLRKRAVDLRAEATADADDAAGGYFEIIPGAAYGPELTEHDLYAHGWPG